MHSHVHRFYRKFADEQDPIRLAFPTFLGWLIFYLESVIHRGIQKLEFGKAGALNLCQALAGGEEAPVETQMRCSRARRQGCQHSQNQLSNHDMYT